MDRRGFLNSGLAATALAALHGDADAEQQNDVSFPIIDVHCHAGHGRDFGKEDADSKPWTTYNDPQWVLDQASGGGIDLSVIFPISNIRYDKANEEIAGYVRQHPDRLVGFAKHDAKTEAGAIRELLVHEVRELGLKGLKLHGVPSVEMLETAGDLGIPVLMHPPTVESCLDVVKDHPEINFILAHLGSFGSKKWQQHMLAIESCKRYPNLHMDTSGCVFFPCLEKAAREVPADQLLFGSDAPIVDARVEIYKLRLLSLPKGKAKKILGGNAARLLGLNVG